MDYIVLDLEWNQCPYGKNRVIQALPFEIIEIGAIKLDENLNRIGEFHRIIRPQKYKKLHFQTQKILHMTEEELKRGCLFDEAMEDFLNWCGKDYIFCTFGEIDLTELQRNMEYFGVENEFQKPLLYYDIQELIAIDLNEDDRKRSLEWAVDNYNVEVEKDKQFHGAFEDAFYTAKLMKNIRWDTLKKYHSVNCFYPPLTPEEEIYLEYPRYSKFVSREFATKERAMKHKYVASSRCFHCKRTLRTKMKWFVAQQKLYEGVFKCPQHGLMLGKIRFKNSSVGNYYVIKTIEEIDKERYHAVEERKKQIKEKKKQRKISIKKRKIGEKGI